MSTDIIAATKHWVKNVIIGLNFCPFAREVFEGDSIDFVELQQDDSVEGLTAIVESVLAECRRMDDDESIATSLLIMNEACGEFYAFLDCVDRANDALYNADYEGVYQLAHFHPDYCFSGEEPSDASNYTNRSPFPTLHIIREADVERALESYPNPENIPQRNIDVARTHGAEYFQEILRQSQDNVKGS